MIPVDEDDCSDIERDPVRPEVNLNFNSDDEDAVTNDSDERASEGEEIIDPPPQTNQEKQGKFLFISINSRKVYLHVKIL